MKFNVFSAATRRLAASTVLSLAVLTGPLTSLAQAEAKRIYSFAGMQFSEADRTKIGFADDETKLGVAALQRSEWANALRHCRAAWGAYSEVMPINDKTRPFFDQVGACLADAHANLGNVDKACGIYRSNGYQTYRVRDPKALCAKYPATN
jgi:hypothetical protein